MKSAAVTFALCTLAILAFAGNSLFARAAFIDGGISASAFSVIRLGAGALILLPFLKGMPRASDWPGGLALAVYALFFTFAYRSLTTATGALILFATVQATIMLVAARRGDRPDGRGWIGVLVALAGLAWLLAPGADAPDLMGALMMMAAGVGWGIYTLIGRAAASATRQVATSFLLASLIALPFLLVDGAAVSREGALLAALSGAFTSGLGYVAWYLVAPRLGIATVSAVQLLTPVAAALLAWPLLGEVLSERLLVGALLILGGILLTLPLARRTS